MSKYLLVFILSLLFTGCRNEGNFDDDASLTGTWQPTKVKVYVPGSGGLISQTENMNDCQLKSRVNYTAVSGGHEIAYEANCDLRFDRTFLYTYDVKNRKLTHTYPTHSNTVSVVSLTTNELVIRTKRTIDGTEYDIEITNDRL